MNKKFFVSFLFIFTLLFSSQNLKPKSDNLISPLANQDRTTILLNEIVFPKLHNFRNSFTLIKKNPFVAQAGASDFYTKAHAAGAIDLSNGEIIFEKNLESKLPIASLTKIMTAIVALDLAGPNEIFTISKNASEQIPTKIGVVAGQRMTLAELLHATLLTSANDAAKGIADGIDSKYGGSIFVKSMNEKAKYIGLKSTSFANPQGFDDPNNYSTVEDLAILTSYALKNYPEIKDIVRKDYQYLEENHDHKQFDLYNWNGLIGVYPKTIGMKIGNTDNAGKTTIVVSNRDNRMLAAIILGATDLFERDLEASNLLDFGYQKIAGLEPIKVTEDQLKAKYMSWNN